MSKLPAVYLIYITEKDFIGEHQGILTEEITEKLGISAEAVEQLME